MKTAESTELGTSLNGNFQNRENLKRLNNAEKEHVKNMSKTGDSVSTHLQKLGSPKVKHELRVE